MTELDGTLHGGRYELDTSSSTVKLNMSLHMEANCGLYGGGVENSDSFFKRAIVSISGGTLKVAFTKGGDRAENLAPDAENRMFILTRTGDRRVAASQLPDWWKVFDRGVDNLFKTHSPSQHRKDALRDANLCIRLDAHRAGGFTLRGLVKINENLPFRAIDDLTTAHILDEKNEVHLRYRALAHLMVGSDKGALRDLNDALRLNDKVAQTHAIRAIHAYRNADYENAIFDCTRAIKLDDKQSSFYWIRGESYLASSIYRRTKQEENAIKDASACIKLNPNKGNGYKLKRRVYTWLGDRGHFSKTEWKLIFTRD